MSDFKDTRLQMRGFPAKGWSKMSPRIATFKLEEHLITKYEDLVCHGLPNFRTKVLQSPRLSVQLCSPSSQKGVGTTEGANLRESPIKSSRSLGHVSIATHGCGGPCEETPYGYLGLDESPECASVLAEKNKMEQPPKTPSYFGVKKWVPFWPIATCWFWGCRTLRSTGHGFGTLPGNFAGIQGVIARRAPERWSRPEICWMTPGLLRLGR